MKGMRKRKGNRCHCNRRRSGRNEVGGRMTGRYNSPRAKRNIYSARETENERRQVRKEKDKERSRERRSISETAS